MYAAAIVVANGLPSLIREPGSLKSSNEFVTSAASPSAIPWISARTGTSARSTMSRYIVSAPHMYESGNCCAEVIVWISGDHVSGQSGFGSLLPLAHHRADLVRASTRAGAGAARATRSPPRRARRASARSRSYAVERGGRRACAPELVARLVGVAARLPVAEPPVGERRDVAGAALHEHRLDARMQPPRTRRASAPGYSASHSRVIPPIVIGCAVKLITAASGEPSSPSTRITLTASSTGRSWRVRLTLSPGARATAEPVARGLHVLPRRVDGAGDEVGREIAT